MRRVMIFVGVLGCLLLRPAWAADATGKYLILGFGNSTCHEVLRLTSIYRDLEGDLVGWLGGYLTATHVRLANTYGLTTVETARDWVMAYCRRNPERQLADAAVALVESFYAQRLTQEPAITLPPVPAAPPALVPMQSPSKRSGRTSDKK